MEIIFLIVVLVVTLVMLMQFGMVWRMQKQAGKPAPDISVLPGHTPGADESVLVYFYSRYCHACKPITPLIEKTREQQNDVPGVNISEHQPITRDFGIMATPTIAMIENNRISALRVVTLQQKQIDQLLIPEIANE
jgi:thioredoxin 1